MLICDVNTLFAMYLYWTHDIPLKNAKPPQCTSAGPYFFLIQGHTHTILSDACMLLWVIVAQMGFKVTGPCEGRSYSHKPISPQFFHHTRPL